MPDDFVADKSAAEMNLKLESEARNLECRVHSVLEIINEKLRTVEEYNCIGARCMHWRWATPSGTRYELRTFQSEFPAPEGNKGPADVEDGWEFAYWDVGWMKAPHPRYWARRAVEVVLARGVCGLAGMP